MFDRIHNSCFNLAEQAPICQGTLRGEFGYLANTNAGQAILDGTYEYSPDFDPGTRELLEECTYIKNYIKPEAISDLISRPEWQRGWRTKKESTSSSISGFHFGHYIAVSQSPILANFHALKLTLSLDDIESML